MSIDARDLWALTKPRLSFLVVMTAAAGIGLAPVALPWHKALLAILGTALVVGAANALNCWLERDVDALMLRTQKRPLVTGRLAATPALIFSVAVGATGCLILGLGLNLLTGLLGLAGILLYAFWYTPLKRKSALALLAGAVPGALPPVMGWTAATNRIDLGAWLLFAILFFWQLPHFIALSLFLKSDYERAGLKTLPGSVGDEAARRHMILSAAFLVVVSFAPFIAGQAGTLYLITALVVGSLFASLCVAGVLGSKPLNWSRIVFFGSLAYLPLVLGMWVVDRWVGSLHQ